MLNILFEIYGTGLSGCPVALLSSHTVIRASPLHFLLTQGDISMTSPHSTSGEPEQAAKGEVRKLKRRFLEIEEKHKETRSEALLSGERNVRVRKERENSNEEFENHQSQSNGLPVVGPTSPVVPVAQSSSATLPRNLLNPEGRNLRETMAEDGVNDVEKHNIDAQQDIQVANRIIVATSANPSPKSSKNSNPPTKSIGTNNPTTFASHSQASSLESTPSMEDIIKVAAAAVAAQNAAAASAAAIAIPSNATQSHQAIDPNLDPSLSSNKGGAASKNLPAVDTKATSSGSNSATNSSTSSATTPTSSLSNNPYLSLSMLAKQNPGSSTPTGHPTMPMHPHPMYYPPNTPITPNTPTYPIYGNPYYYLAGSMAPGSNGMFLPLPPGAFPPPAQQPLAEPSRTVKSKRLKAHTVTTKSFSIPMVPRDKGGKPMLPLNVGIMTVINLGEVCMREHFHTERYIFPVGYEVTRRYLSTIDSSIEVVYHCTILDGGDGPKFQIIPSDRADKPIIAGTATGAWSNIVKQANAIRNRQHSNSVSGPDFFGLAQNTIKHLIQELPNSDRLRGYVWQNFVEGGPLGGRHAAVIPALPEEYDASMPIGAYYPKREVSANPGVPRGLSHYPQHIIAQAEAQKSQQQANGSANGGPSSSSSSQQDGSTPTRNATQSNHMQIPMAPASSSKGLNIQHYQPIQQTQVPSQGPQKRATRSSNTSAPSASGRSTRASARASQREQQEQNQQQQQPVSVSAPDTSMSPAPEAIPTTFVGIMSQFPVPGLAETPHSAGS